LKTVIVRLAEPEQSGGELHGLVEEIGAAPVRFRGADALVRLLTAAATREPTPPHSTPDPPPT
jgi:hypothetical protein